MTSGDYIDPNFPGTGYTQDIYSQIPTTTGTQALSTLGLAPVIVGAGTITLGVAKWLLQRFGSTALKALVGGLAFKEIMDLIFGGASDETTIKVRKKSPRRYSIGSNPRLNTLLKVGKRVDNIFARYDSRIRKFRSRLRGSPRPRRRYYDAPNPYLSPVERRALNRGR